MSCTAVDDSADGVCANCGKSSEDGTVKLKKCTACRLVKYCGVDCHRAHRKHHKKAFKQRAAELKEEQLYSQGQERPEGDFCPICTLPIPLPMGDHPIGATATVCCMKKICHGCNFAAESRGMPDCPFCRSQYPVDDADAVAMINARVKKKDPYAINHLGEQYLQGHFGLQKDMRKALELFEEAAELDSKEALYSLGSMYYHGEGVEQDKEKGSEFYKKAAMQGCVTSRYNVAMIEKNKGNWNSALKHLLISAKMGHKESIVKIKDIFMAGAATKEQYTDAPRGYQNAVEEMKSDDRDEAKRLGYWKGKNRCINHQV